MKLRYALVLVLALPALATASATAQTRTKAEVQTELDALKARTRQLESSLAAAQRAISRYRTQKELREVRPSAYQQDLAALDTPETNPELVERSKRSGRDIYDEAIEDAQNQRRAIELDLSAAKRVIEKDKAELANAPD